MTLAAATLVAVAMTVASWLLVASVRTALRADQRNASTLAAAQATEQLERGTPVNLLSPPSPPGFVVVVVDSRGRIIGGSPGYTEERWRDFVGDAENADAVVGPNGAPFPGAIVGERHVWFVGDRIIDSTPLRIGGDVGYLVAAGPAGVVEPSVRTLRTTLWWAVPTFVLLVGALAWYLTGRALRPVEVIRSEVTAITHSSLDRRVSEPRAKDEVGRLARTMNEMLDRLEDASVRQQRFVSDASHELRSPVSAIRTAGEVALAHPERADWHEVVRRMLAEDARMEQLVADLLTLARTAEATPVPDQVVDLDEVVMRETTVPARPDVVVSRDRVSAGRVRGSEEQLTRVVRNLFDNAVRHAAERVRLTLHPTEDGAVELVVEDDGPGVPAADRERVFERFTRLDEGRARDAGGLGLGLAMVRSITEWHGGTALVTDAVDDDYPGARVVVRLPAAP
jgi:signal transduction histidine kinase